MLYFTYESEEARGALMGSLRMKRFRNVVAVSGLVLGLLCLTSLCLGAEPSVAAWQAYAIDGEHGPGAYALADPLSPDQPFTVISQVRVDLSEAGLSEESEELWMAGVAGAQGEPPTLLAVTWRLEGSAWFPTWKLYVESDAGLLPTGERQIPLGWNPNVPLKDATDYTTVVSYDPALGVLSVRISETETGLVQCTGNVELKAYSGPLYPGVGYQGATARLEIDDLAVQQVFVPVGARAHVLTRESPEGAFLFATAADRRDEWVLDLALPNRCFENDVVLLLDAGGALTELWRQKTGGGQTIPLPATSMPAGEIAFVLQYEADGVAWELDRAPLRVGAVDARVEALALDIGEDGVPGFTGVMRVSSDGAVPPCTFGVAYKAQAPGRVGPLHEKWAHTSGSVTLQASDIGIAPVELPFRLPLEPLADRVGNQEIFVTLEVSAIEVEVPFFTASGLDRIATGERAQAFPKVGDYLVLRGDFHTHTNLSDGKISPQDRVWESYMYGYDVLALSDHRTMAAYDYGLPLADQLGLTLVHGFETGIEGKQHLVVLGADPSYQMRDEHSWARKPGGPRAYYQDQIKDIIAHGGMIIYAHPGGEWALPGPYTYAEGPLGWSDEIQWMVDQGYLHGMESRGHLSADRRDSSYRWAIEHGLTLFDVTDVHEARNFNRGDQAPMTLVLAKEATEEAVMEALWEGRTLIVRNGTLRGKQEWLVPFMEAVIEVGMVEKEGGVRLQATNKSALAFYGTAQMAGGIQASLWLAPFSTFEFAGPADAKGVTIRWGNVQDYPNRAFVSQHLVK